ncbi:hypothetical protein GCM10009872_26160 [Actinopolymorpha rutila]
MSVVECDELLVAVGTNPDHDQQAHLVLLEADLEVDPIDPHVTKSVSASDRLLNAAALSCQSFVKRVITEADRPWLVPRNWVSAGPKSEEDRPCR